MSMRAWASVCWILGLQGIGLALTGWIARWRFGMDCGALLAEGAWVVALLLGDGYENRDV